MDDFGLFRKVGDAEADEGGSPVQGFGDVGDLAKVVAAEGLADM